MAGTVDDHESCYTDIECESPGARCEAQSCGDACCLGTCTPRGREGESCDSFDGCEPGLVCDLSGTCVNGDVDSHCEDLLGCDANGWCDRQAEICKPDVPEGAPCTRLTQCGGETTCVGLRRTAEPARCRRVTVEGDPCDWYCLGNLYCDLSGTTGFGVCRSLPRDGEPCDAFLPCIGANQTCHLGRCVARPGDGEPCLDGVCHPGLRCADGATPGSFVCRPLLADEDDGCTATDQCQSHICDGDPGAAGQCQPWDATCP